MTLAIGGGAAVALAVSASGRWCGRTRRSYRLADGRRDSPRRPPCDWCGAASLRPHHAGGTVAEFRRRPAAPGICRHALSEPGRRPHRGPIHPLRQRSAGGDVAEPARVRHRRQPGRVRVPCPAADPGHRRRGRGAPPGTPPIQARAAGLRHPRPWRRGHDAVGPDEGRRRPRPPSATACTTATPAASSVRPRRARASATTSSSWRRPSPPRPSRHGCTAASSSRNWRPSCPTTASLCFRCTGPWATGAPSRPPMSAAWSSLCGRRSRTSCAPSRTRSASLPRAGRASSPQAPRS